MVSSLDLSSTTITSSADPVGMRLYVSAIVRAALWAGMTTITFGSVTARLDVDGTAAPQHDLGGGAGKGKRQQHDCGCDRSKPRPPADGQGGGAGRPQRLIEVEVPWQRADEALQPADNDLAAADPADAHDLPAVFLETGDQRLGRQVDQVPRQVEREPVVPEDPCLQTGRVRHRDEDAPARL